MAAEPMPAFCLDGAEGTICSDCCTFTANKLRALPSSLQHPVAAFLRLTPTVHAREGPRSVLHLQACQVCLALCWEGYISDNLMRTLYVY